MLIILSSIKYYTYKCFFIYKLWLVTLFRWLMHWRYNDVKTRLVFPYIDGILPKGPYLPCLRMADRALLAGYPWIMSFILSYLTSQLHRARFLSLVRSKLRLCSANHGAGYFSNLACDWLSIVWAYSGQETENGPWCTTVTRDRRITHTQMSLM